MVNNKVAEIFSEQTCSNLARSRDETAVKMLFVAVIDIRRRLPNLYM